MAMAFPVFFSPLLLVCPRQLSSAWLGSISSILFCSVLFISFRFVSTSRSAGVSTSLSAYFLLRLNSYTATQHLSYVILSYRILHPTSTPGYRALRVCPLVAYFSFVRVVSRRNTMQNGIGT
jgi:hypothetical protein